MTAVRDWELWSTECRMVVTDPDALGAATDLIDEELAGIDQACSRFRPDSELMTLRRTDGAAMLGPVLTDLMAAALDAARETDGAVDPTLGSVLAGLGYDRDIAELRTSEAGTTPVVLSTHPGWRSLRLAGSRLELPAGTQLDLGATAKAVAADRCAHLVADRLDTGVLVSLGGDIATAGESPEGGWQVRVQDLPADVPQQISLYAGAAIATSSTARRTWVQEGQERHHLIDPATRLPVRGPWRSVSVVAPTCLKANTASTAALVKGGQAVGFLTTTGLPARLVAQDGRTVTVNRWPREESVA